MAQHPASWHCLARAPFGGFVALHCAIQHSDCQETHSDTPSLFTPTLHLSPAFYARCCMNSPIRPTHTWFVPPRLIHLWLETLTGCLLFLPPPYLPRRRLITPPLSLRLPPPQPKTLHTHGDKYHLCRHPPTPAPEERELWGGFLSCRPPPFPRHAPLCHCDNSSSASLFSVPRVWTGRWDLGGLRPAVVSGHGCKAPGIRLESLCHSLQWSLMSEIHLNHVHVPHSVSATCPHRDLPCSLFKPTVLHTLALL